MVKYLGMRLSVNPHETAKLAKKSISRNMHAIKGKMRAVDTDIKE